jgi:thiosulfate/3-mercaptopyruvate sulfurtransferase
MSSHYAHPEALVETSWVAQHGNDVSVRLLEVDLDTTAYDVGHIAGAVGWNWQTQLQDPVRRTLASRQQFESLCSESGITPETTVIVYGDNNNWFAAWAVWQFHYYGHKNVKLMNGGRKKWLLENRPVTKDKSVVARTTYVAKDPDWSLRALREQVMQALKEPNRVSLVDVRSTDEFTGRIVAPPGMTETAQRGGHIPGAQSIPWVQAVQADGSFKSFEDLKTLYQDKGILPNKETITYCRIGERSSHTWFVLKYLLGYKNVRNYDGSWTEWGNLIEAPIEKSYGVTTTTEAMRK